MLFFYELNYSEGLSPLVRIEPQEPSLWFDFGSEMCPHVVKKAKIEPSPIGHLIFITTFIVSFTFALKTSASESLPTSQP